MAVPETITLPTGGDTAAATVVSTLPGIIWQVWTAYLHAEPATAATAEDVPESAEVTASVCIAGVWPGLVVLRGTVGATGAVAAAMMGLQPENVEADDIEDATGELMNIVAGNVKSLLPQPSFVSLPQVVFGHAKVVWPGTVLVHRVAVRWETHVVHVDVLRQEL